MMDYVQIVIAGWGRDDASGVDYWVGYATFVYK